MAISSLGAGSGLDLSGILSSLMQVEQQPLLALQTKEASYQARISALGTLKGALSSLQTAAQSFIPSTGQTAADKYSTYKASVADSSIATASAGGGAVSGSYSLEVSTLAVAHRLTSVGNTDASLSNASRLTGMNSSLASGGTLKIELGKLSGTGYTVDSTKTLEVTIASGSTLEKVRDAINAAATDGRVSATIISGSNGKQLVLSSKQTGTANVLRLSSTDGMEGFAFDPTATSNALSQAATDGGQAASDAAFNLNGIAATSSTNSVTGVLDGVTLTLLKTTTSATTLTVSRDNTSSLTSTINAFVKAYNDAAKSMKDLGYYDANTQKSGALQGDASLRGAQNQVRDLLRTRADNSSAYQTLSDIGIALLKDGTLKLDSSKLNKAIEADYNNVVALASKVGSAFKSGLESLVGTAGSIAAATDSTNRIIKDIGKRQEILANRLTQIEARYRKQFSSLDSAIAGMKQTSSWLTQQLANLPGASQ